MKEEKYNKCKEDEKICNILTCYRFKNFFYGIIFLHKKSKNIKKSIDKR